MAVPVRSFTLPVSLRLKRYKRHKPPLRRLRRLRRTV
jgi:hypothetical protein